MSQATQLLKTLIAPPTSQKPRVVLHDDATGGTWIKTFVPVPPATLYALQGMAVTGAVELIREPMPPEFDSRAIEMAWVHDHLPELQAEFSGEWIAVDGPLLVGHASDLSVLVQLVIQDGHPHPFITAVPVGMPKPFYG